jgi:phospholipid/cholesterol/gamma-HCH transport system substrate-binding protein
MTDTGPATQRGRWLRIALAAILAATLAVGVYLVWPSRTGHKVVDYFTSAVSLYPGDDVRVVGVPVGEIDAIEPRATDVKITMTVKDGVKVPADARAIIVAPNLVSARFVQLTPAYTGGPEFPDGGGIGLDRTAVPVEWDEVKEQLTQAQQATRAATGIGAGTAERVRQPGRRHLRRQWRFVPAGAARTVADRG